MSSTTMNTTSLVGASLPDRHYAGRQAAFFSTTTTTTTPRPQGFLRRLTSTPRGRVSLALGLVAVGVVDYEIWWLYKHYTKAANGPSQ
jgi:hypothetical protein